MSSPLFIFPLSLAQDGVIENAQRQMIAVVPEGEHQQEVAELIINCLHERAGFDADSYYSAQRQGMQQEHLHLIATLKTIMCNKIAIEATSPPPPAPAAQEGGLLKRITSAIPFLR